MVKRREVLDVREALKILYSAVDNMLDQTPDGESVGHPVQCDKEVKQDYSCEFYVVDMGQGETIVTRSRNLASEPKTRRLLRFDIYRGREEDAEDEYAHQFICGGFPKERDPKRPSREEWMALPPFEYEVDKFVTKKLFGNNDGSK